MENHHSHSHHQDGEASRVQKMIEEQIHHLLHRREEVLSKVQAELDDIDAALHKLGHHGHATHAKKSTTRTRTRAPRAERQSDDSIKAKLSEILHGKTLMASEIISQIGINKSRFNNFKAKNKGFLKSEGAKKSTRYSIA